ncbi:MAG: winged helix-turn-helix transcriptional regulator [Actinobacteria bacterium]|nr:winged helix-turn-helix transcriptional regulator [Actinomycetota bacterium]
MLTPQIPQMHLDAWRSLLNAHSTVTELAEKALRSADLPPLAWYDVLWALRRSPERRSRMGELAESVTLSRGGLTKLVDRIEAAGLLRRETCATDRRGYEAVLTDAGVEMLRRMWPVYAAVLEDAIVAVLANEDAEQLAEMLDRVARTAARPVEEPVR